MAPATIDLVNAIRARDETRLRDLIAAGANLAEVSPTGRTFLHIAAEEGDAAIANVLLDRGAPVNARTNNRETPLHFAARYGRSGLPEFMLVNLESRQHDPWERRAKKLVDPGTARVILELARRRNQEIPADLGVTDEVPEDIKGDVFVAIMEQMLDKTRLMEDLQKAGIAIESLNPDFVEQFRGYPRYVATAQLLMDRGAEVNALDKFGQAPLHLAIQSGELAMIDLLLKRKADPNIRMECAGRQCATPMEEAISYYREDAAQMLYAHGAIIDFDSLHPLHTTAGNGQLDLLLWLLQVGGNINSEDNQGDTPIMRAANNGHDDVVQALADGSADLLHTNQRGQQVLHFAAAWNSCLRPLLGRGLDLNARDAEGTTPLHEAARAINEQSVKLLADAGADVNAKDKVGNTPLHIIIFGEGFSPDIDFPAFEMLIAAGADRSLCNNEGKTPFDLATSFRYPGQYLDLLKPR